MWLYKEREEKSMNPMVGVIVVVVAIFLCVFMLIYLFGDEVKKVIGKSPKNSEKKGKKVIPSIKPKVNETIIFLPQENREVKVDRTEFSIGRASYCNLVLPSDVKVELKHAIIHRRAEYGRIYYELVNYSKDFRVEYLNKVANRFEFLEYKEGVELGKHDVFYIGDIKLKTTVNINQHMPSPSDRHIVEKNNERSEQVFQQRYESRPHTASKRMVVDDDENWDKERYQVK